jgi:hypothetical protein
MAITDQIRFIKRIYPSDEKNVNKPTLKVFESE